MIKNFLLVAWRSLWKDKVAACVNLAGLATGMACCMLIWIYIKDELSFNKFNAHFADIYRVNWTAKIEGQSTTVATTPIALAPVIASDLPEVRQVARLYQRSGEMEAQALAGQPDPGRRFQEQGVWFSDNGLGNIFTLGWIEGDSASALKDPDAVVLTDEMARKYFGSADPLGRTLNYENKVALKVTGVVRKPPPNSDLQFDFLVSFKTLFSVETPDMAKFLRTDWVYNPVYVFLLLRPGADPGRMGRLLQQLLMKYADTRSKELHTLSVQPLGDIHLHASTILANPSQNSISNIYIFAAIAILILLIASLNFINLSTARAGTRSLEVGMRKILGADKRRLVLQFLGENALLGLLAFILAFTLTWLAIPLLDQLTSKTLGRWSWVTPLNLLGFFGIFVCMAAMAGLYPAFFLARFNPARSLRGKGSPQGLKNGMRKALLVVQFTISIVLASCALGVFRQWRFLINKPLGFQKEQVMTVPIFGTGASSIDYAVDAPMRQRILAFTDELSRCSGIIGVTAASALPGQGYVMGLVVPQGNTDKDNIFVPWVSVDYNFLSTMKIPIVAGRDFSKAAGTDNAKAFILSESAVRSFGWKSDSDAIGKTMIRGDQVHGKKGFVIGVIKDFNFNPLDMPMQPLIMDVNVPRFTQFAIRVRPDHLPATIDFVRSRWNKFFPERVFEFSFLDKDIAANYETQDQLSTLVESFAGLAIVLCCMGIFSLTSFLAARRVREIGIRKVLGARVDQIVTLLSIEFVWLIGLSFVIAALLAWWALREWLDGFAYRIRLGADIFLLSGLLVLVVAALTVCGQAVRAALANPVRSLRNE